MKLSNAFKPLRRFRFTRINIRRSVMALSAMLFCTAALGQYASAAIDQSFYESNNILYYDPTACDPDAAAGSGTLTGNSEAEKIWNYLVGNGLSEKQAAGIMGNMKAESGFVPTRHQNPGPVDKDSGYGKAWGLVQWDGGRRWAPGDKGVVGALKKNNSTLAKYISAEYDYGAPGNAAAKSKIPPKDLDALILFELDYLKQESQSRPTTAKGFSSAGKEWDTLKKQDSIEKATVFWHNNFEVSADTAAMIQNRVGFANDAYASFAGKAAASTPSANTDDDSSATKPVVYLDPGHGGAIGDYADEKTGLVTNETHNMPESEDVLQVANRVKGELEKDGYTVIVGRKTNDDKIKFRERADAAKAGKASIGISLHTSPHGPNDAWPQHDGFRQYGSHKDTFGDDATEKKTIDTSLKYAKIIAATRQSAEGHDISIDANLDHQNTSFNRGDNIKSKGNIPFVSLWSPTVPWVYNEIAQDGPGASLTDKTKAAYTKGIVDGVKQALPVAGGSDACSGSDFAGGDFEKTLLAYAWPTYHSPNYLDKMPAYAKAVQAAQKEGRYVGGGVNPGIDCGGFITTLMIDSGFEPDYNYGGKGPGAGPTTSQEAWLKSNWKFIGNSGSIDAASIPQGAVAINGEHTFVYAAQKGGKKIDGFGSVTASASYSPHNTAWRAPMAGPELPNTPGFRWYAKK